MKLTSNEAKTILKNIVTKGQNKVNGTSRNK